jgi:NADH-quinone oxidoreductase subunit B
MLMVMGHSKKMALFLRHNVQTSEPRWVIAVGACASSGGIFDVAVLCTVLNVIIPWMFIKPPGCPPRPEQMLMVQ